MLSEIKPYLPRNFRFHSIWNIDDLRLKFYTITRGEDNHVPPVLVANCKAYAAATLPQARREEGDDHRLGYAMLHLGEMSNWLLIHWWAHQDIALRLLASAVPGSDRFRSQDHRRFHACVWEHLVIDHERQAWVRTMMIGSNNPKDYLDDRLGDGVY